LSEVTVIGGGIIGVCCALSLQRQGIGTTLIERGDIGGEATLGNCALMARSEIVPLSKPGVMKKLPGWILDSEEPLAVRPGHLPTAIPWLLKFLRNARADRVAQICHGLGEIAKLAQDDFDNVIEAANIKDIWAENEVLYLYDSKSQYDADTFSWNLREAEGCFVTPLNKNELRDLEPDVKTDEKFGVIANGWKSFTNPQRLTKELANFFVASGGKIIAQDVARITMLNGRADQVKFENGETLKLDKLVVAAGCWAGRLLSDMGIRIPLAPLHGYHTDLPDSGVKLSRAVIYAPGGFVNTPVETGLRIAGTVEIAPVDAKPNFRRAEVLVEKAKRNLFPQLNTSNGSQWIGARPFMPDTLPVIGPAPKVNNAWLAVGHGQLGLTMGPTTGELISALILGKTPAIPIEAYRADRRYVQ
jgi:D-amino-acid dehydrogenase